MASKITGAEVFWKSLIHQGVDVVFGYPGAATLPIYGMLDSFDGQIRHVLSRHEQGATNMADGYARVSGKVGVAMATSGPGATNMVGGIALAMRDASPIVCITGQVNTTSIGTDAFQEVDMIDISMPITKHNFMIEHVDDLANTIHESFHIARSGRPGPVLIDIPKNIQTEVTKYETSNTAINLPEEEENLAQTTKTSANIIHHNLSAAIGASFHRKDEAIWVIESNTLSQMAVAELATMVQENANIKVIVANNRGSTRENAWLPDTQPDYFKLAQAYGIPGYRIKQLGDVFPIIHLAQAQQGPVLIESRVEIYDLYAMLSAHPVVHQIFRRSYAPIRHKCSKGKVATLNGK
jgi:thiamine pyrophosphate-dependent acetolactate synthase large subunit-like protein